MNRFYTIFKFTLITSALLFAFITAASAEWQGDHGYEPPKENLESREWFQDAKFGLFVHWGIYSIPAKEEWVMNNDKIPVAEYEKFAGQFNPISFDADEWCRIVKGAGMKYITITSKHHDGFAMFDSAVSDYDIVDSTPYGKDVLKMLADACERHGLKLFFYHSQLDWHHPDYYPLGRTGNYDSGRADNGTWKDYIDYMNGQLKELCTNYGTIGGIWFDGMWDKPESDWHLYTTYRLIHGLQPQAMIGSNHHRAPFEGEDFQMFERGLPGNDPYNKEGTISALPLETCETMNKHWGYANDDKDFKSPRELIHYLVKAAGNNSNLLLNVGPKPDGTIQSESVELLAEMGKWLRTNGGTVYGTRGGPVPPQEWGVSTQKDGVIYLHVLASTDDVISIPNIDKRISGMTLLDGTAVAFEKTSLGTIIKLPERDADTHDTIIVVK
ncbi:alpha-L-fucosidase [Candidatus Latescibacterota bacterium]